MKSNLPYRSFSFYCDKVLEPVDKRERCCMATKLRMSSGTNCREDRHIVRLPRIMKIGSLSAIHTQSEPSLRISVSVCLIIKCLAERQLLSQHPLRTVIVTHSHTLPFGMVSMGLDGNQIISVLKLRYKIKFQKLRQSCTCVEFLR